MKNCARLAIWAARKPSNTSSGRPPGLFAVFSMIGGTAPIRTALATRPFSARQHSAPLAAAGGMADMDGVLQVQRPRQLDDIGGIGVHLIAGIGLGRAAMTTAVMRDHPIALGIEVEHLVIQSSAVSGQP
jgi:hypothetical protein